VGSRGRAFLFYTGGAIAGQVSSISSAGRLLVAWGEKVSDLDRESGRVDSVCYLGDRQPHPRDAVA